METAIVLVSGGVDSAVALWWAKRQSLRIIAVHFEFAGRPRGERRAARRLGSAAGVEEGVSIELPFFAQARPSGYLPKRNLVYYAIAGAVAELRGASRVIGGHLKTDAGDFPDAHADFFARVAELWNVVPPGEGAVPCRVELPLIDLDKAGAIRLGRSLGAPFELTWSCYVDGENPCGRCGACRERQEAFAAAGMADPAFEGAK